VGHHVQQQASGHQRQRHAMIPTPEMRCSSSLVVGRPTAEALKRCSAREAVRVQGCLLPREQGKVMVLVRMASTVAAADRTVRSDPISPSRVRPTGSPSAAVPAGTEMAGVPATAAEVAFATSVLRTSAFRPLWKNVLSSPIMGSNLRCTRSIRGQDMSVNAAGSCMKGGSRSSSMVSTSMQSSGPCPA
jgi:hypothetical protein